VEAVLRATCGSLEESFSTEIDPLGKALRKLFGDGPLELRSHDVRKNLDPLLIIGYALKTKHPSVVQVKQNYEGKIYE
jgi:hypothetical protein